MQLLSDQEQLLLRKFQDMKKLEFCNFFFLKIQGPEVKGILISCAFGLKQITNFLLNMSQGLEKENHYSDFFPHEAKDGLF